MISDKGPDITSILSPCAATASDQRSFRNNYSSFSNDKLCVRKREGRDTGPVQPVLKEPVPGLPSPSLLLAEHGQSSLLRDIRTHQTCSAPPPLSMCSISAAPCSLWHLLRRFCPGLSSEPRGPKPGPGLCSMDSWLNWCGQMRTRCSNVTLFTGSLHWDRSCVIDYLDIGHHWHHHRPPNNDWGRVDVSARPMSLAFMMSPLFLCMLVVSIM